MEVIFIMNRFSNISATLMVALFLLTFCTKSEALGQCPSGQLHYVDTLLVGGCLYEVDMCIECTVTHPGRVTYKSVTPLDSSCVNGLSHNQLLQQVLSQTSNWAYIYFNACPQNFPPCDTTAKRITFSYPVCWTVILDTMNHRYWYSRCDSTSCDVTYDFCMKYPEMNIQKTFVSMTEVNFEPQCTLEGYQIELPDEHNEHSECFILHTPCNPDGGWTP